MSFAKHIHELSLMVLAAPTLLSGQTASVQAPKIWDDAALKGWATPIAALGVRPAQFTSAEYYAVPADNLKTYPVYRPDKEPPGYWEWLQKQKPQPLVDASKARNRGDWIKSGEAAFHSLDEIWRRRGGPEAIRAARNVAGYDGVWTLQDGTVPRLRWVVTAGGVRLGFIACAGCHSRLRADGTVLWGAPFGVQPPGSRRFAPTLPPPSAWPDPPLLREPSPITFWRVSTVPWAPDPRIEKVRDMNDETFAAVRSRSGAFFSRRVKRHHTNSRQSFLHDEDSGPDCYSLQSLYQCDRDSPTARSRGHCALRGIRLGS